MAVIVEDAEWSTVDVVTEKGGTTVCVRCAVTKTNLDDIIYDILRETDSTTDRYNCFIETDV